MGKGDKRTMRGKLAAKSFGNARNRKIIKAKVARTEKGITTKAGAAAKAKAAVKPVAKPAVKKTTTEKKVVTKKKD
jgi:ribosomal small subunit protein bTHX